MKCPLRIIKALSYIVCYSRPFFQVLDEASEFGGVTGWCRALLAVNCSPLQVTEPTKLRVALKENGNKISSLNKLLTLPILKGFPYLLNLVDFAVVPAVSCGMIALTVSITISMLRLTLLG